MLRIMRAGAASLGFGGDDGGEVSDEAFAGAGV